MSLLGTQELFIHWLEVPKFHGSFCSCEGLRVDLFRALASSKFRPLKSQNHWDRLVLLVHHLLNPCFKQNLISYEVLNLSLLVFLEIFIFFKF